MARSWEYSSTRRRVMQGLMWVLFLASLGVAGVLSNRKPVTPKITLVSEPRRLGELLVHAPAGWRVSQEIAQGKRELTMIESPAEGEGRGCVISLQSLEEGAMTARALLLDVSGDSTDTFSDFTFKHLGKGVSAAVTTIQGSPTDPELSLVRPSLSASIVLPRPHQAGQSLGVVVSFFGSAPPTPIDQQWLQRIADNLSLDKSTTAPAEMDSD